MRAEAAVADGQVAEAGPPLALGGEKAEEEVAEEVEFNSADGIRLFWHSVISLNRGANGKTSHTFNLCEERLRTLPIDYSKALVHILVKDLSGFKTASLFAGKATPFAPSITDLLLFAQER